MIYTAHTKKEIAFILILLFSLYIFTTNALAKVYTCKEDGYVIYQDTPCKRVIKTNKGTAAFDNWTLGISIKEMKNQARAKKMPMRPISIAYVSGYNKKIINSKPKDRTYAYNTKLLGKSTQVKLYFTETSKKLYRIEATVHAVTAKLEERKLLYEKLYTQLCEKYGEPKKADTEQVRNLGNTPSGIISKQFGRTFIGQLFVWSPKPNNAVTLNYKKRYESLTFYKLNYTDMKLSEQNKRETTRVIQSQTNKAIQLDSNRL